MVNSTQPQTSRQGGSPHGEGARAAAAPVWHLLSADDAARQLDVNLERGLDGDEAARRLARDGRNELPEGRARPLWRMVLDQFNDFMILVLIAAAVVSGVIGEPVDTIAIVVIVVLNAVIGVVQEWRAEKAMAALRRMAAPTARVRRSGETLTVAAEEIVAGDVVLLEAGNIVPADQRLVEAVSLRCAEAALTGESQAVEKNVAALAGTELAVGDRVNLAFKGTTVVYGRGEGVVVATGLATELGKIAALLGQGGEVRTPLQKRLAAFGSRLAWSVLAICGVVFAAGLLRGEPVVLMFLTAVSLAVAAIPEALPAVVTISLALGAYRMVRRNALIRRLPAVETLGSITYICSDKTGTLTENRMRVEGWYVDGERRAAVSDVRSPHRDALLTALALSNDAHFSGDGDGAGDPTEVALLEAARDAGFDKAALEAGAPRIAEVAFDSERKRMTTLHRDGEGVVAYVKGAPEAVVPACVDVADRAALLAQAERMAADGLRVLALATRRLDAVPQDLGSVEAELSFLGFVGLMDPPRQEAQQAVEECRSAGITPVMITGDHPATARAIAARLGILDGAGDVVTGAELAGLSDAELAARVADIRVYARVDPAQKIRIVQALQARGEFVAMTGDGVNDAPALARADIGVAMGKGGTDVAREASSMVLTDDNFATIVHAVREGRRIFDNIRKFIKYTMTSNAGEIWTIFLAPFMGLPIPLLPIHILWINLVTDGLPGLALAAEPAERGVMQRPPRPPSESIFAHGMWQHMIWVGLLMGAAALATQAFSMHMGWHWQTMVFTVLTLSQLGHVLAISSTRESFFTHRATHNLALAGAVLLTFGLQMATIYVPWLNPIFKTEPLTVAELAFCLALSSTVFVAVEIEKWLVRTGRLYPRTRRPPQLID